MSESNVAGLGALQKEREAYEVMVEDGKLFYKQSRELVDTSAGCRDSKWIFVLSTSKTLYVGKVNPEEHSERIRMGFFGNFRIEVDGFICSSSLWWAEEEGNLPALQLPGGRGHVRRRETGRREGHPEGRGIVPHRSRERKIWKN